MADRFVVAIVLVVIRPGLLETVSDFFGIEQPINLLFVGAFFVIFLLLGTHKGRASSRLQRLALDVEKATRG